MFKEKQAYLWLLGGQVNTKKRRVQSQPLFISLLEREYRQMRPRVDKISNIYFNLLMEDDLLH